MTELIRTEQCVSFIVLISVMTDFKRDSSSLQLK